MYGMSRLSNNQCHASSSYNATQQKMTSSSPGMIEENRYPVVLRFSLKLTDETPTAVSIIAVFSSTNALHRPIT